MNSFNSIRWAVVGLSCLTFVNIASAQKGFSNEEPTLNRQVRNLGMGNVGVALDGSADSSPFYNPAGLNDLTTWRLQLFSITTEVSNNAFGIAGDVKGLLDDIDDATNDADKVRALNRFVQENTGRPQHMRLSLNLINFSMKNFAAGLVLDERLDLAFRNPIPESFEMRNLGDISAYVSGSYGFWDKLLQVGATVRPTVRLALDEADQEIDYTDVQGEDADGDTPIKGQVKNIYQDQRFGLGVDLGVKSNLGFGFIKDKNWYKFLKPQVGVTWQDIGSPSFGTAVGNEQSLSVGASVSPKFWILKNSFAVDVRALNQETPFLSKLHVGFESRLPWILSVRGGLSQGYLAGGLGIDLKVVKLDAAIYSQEVGQSIREEGDLRYALNLNFNI